MDENRCVTVKEPKPFKDAHADTQITNIQIHPKRMSLLYLNIFDDFIFNHKTKFFLSASVPKQEDGHQ